MLAVQPQQADRNPLVAPLVRQLPNAEGVLQNLGNARPVATVQKGVCSTVCGAIKTFVLKIFAYIGRFFAFLCSCGRRQRNNVENDNNVEARRRRQRPEREDNERPAPVNRGYNIINEANPRPYVRNPNMPRFQIDAGQYRHIAMQMGNRSHRALERLVEAPYGEQPRLLEFENVVARMAGGHDLTPAENAKWEEFREILGLKNLDAIGGEAENMIFDLRGLQQRPALIATANDANINQINIDDLMACFDEVYQATRNDRDTIALRRKIQTYVNFIMLRGEEHHGQAYTDNIQALTRRLIAEMRKEGTSPDKKMVVFVNMASVIDEHGCHPRRLNEIDKRIKFLMGYGLGPRLPGWGENDSLLYHTIVMFKAEDEEDIILRTLQGGQFHVISPARTLIGDEWGLNHHPNRDEYEGVGARQADEYREVLEDQYTPAAMIAKILDRFRDDDRYMVAMIPRALQEIIARLPENQRDDVMDRLNPDAPDSFYDPAQPGVYSGNPRPNARMVRFVLQTFGFLMRDPAARPEPARVRAPRQNNNPVRPGQQPQQPQQPGAIVRRELNPEELQIIAEYNLDETNEQIAAVQRSADNARRQLGLDVNNAPRQLAPEENLPNLAVAMRNRFIGILAAEVARRIALQARLPQLEAGRRAVPRPTLNQIAQLNPQNIDQFINARVALVRPIQERLRAALANDRGVIQLELDTEYATLQLARARRAELIPVEPNPANEE